MKKNFRANFFLLFLYFSMSLTEPFEVVAKFLLPLTNLMEAFLFKVAVSLAAVPPGLWPQPTFAIIGAPTQIETPLKQ